MIFGQSGGGAKVVTLMAMARRDPVPRRRDDERPACHRGRPQPRDRARRPGWPRWAPRSSGTRGITDRAPGRERGDDRSDRGKGEISFTSTLDHDVLRRHPFFPDAPREAGHIPLIVGNTHDETGYWLGDTLRRGDTTWDNLPARLAREMVKDVGVRSCHCPLPALYPDRTAGQILLAASTAGRSWPGHLIQAEDARRSGHRPGCTSSIFRRRRTVACSARFTRSTSGWCSTTFNFPPRGPVTRRCAPSGWADGRCLHPAGAERRSQWTGIAGLAVLRPGAARDDDLRPREPRRKRSAPRRAPAVAVAPYIKPGG